MDALGFVVLVWLVLGIAAAAIASGKGRSGFGWFLIGFLFGPFGLLAALLVSGNQDALNARAVADGQSKKCPFCAEVIKAEATVCRYCGKEMETVAPPLRDLGAEIIDAASDGSFSRVSSLVGEGANVNATNENGETALIIATRRGDLGLVRALLRAGADLGVKDGGGFSAIHYASRAKNRELLALFKASLSKE